MASVDTMLPMASLGARRTRAGAVGHAQPSSPQRRAHGGAGTQGDEDGLDDFHATPPLAPVSRSQQASVLAASFLAIALTIGYNQCYGVFQEYYLSAGQDVLQPSSRDGGQPPATPSTALLAFVGTLGAGLTWAGSIFVNPWLSRVEHAAAAAAAISAAGRAAATPAAPTPWPRRAHAAAAGLIASPRGITLAGVALTALGFLAASFATQVWHLLLTQGLLYGVGSSMLYFPLLGPAPEYFTRHRATALGLILSGGGVGSVVLTPVVRALLSAVGGRWTLRFLAALELVVGAPVAWSVPPSRFPVIAASGSGGAPAAPASAAGLGDSEMPPLPATATAAATASQGARRRTHVSAALLGSPVFLLSVATAFCQSAGGQLPLTFVPSYSVALGLSASTGATLLAVANIVNAAARVAAGYAGDRFGRLNVLAVCLATSAVAVGALWGKSVEAAGAAPAPASAPTHLWLAFVVLYSVAAGGYYALFPATIADVFGIRSYAAVNGFIYFVRGCGTMLGSPIGGVLLGAKGGASSPSGTSYAGVVVWDGAVLVGSALCALGVRWADAARRGWAWRA